MARVVTQAIRNLTVLGPLTDADTGKMYWPKLKSVVAAWDGE